MMVNHTPHNLSDDKLVWKGRYELDFNSIRKNINMKSSYVTLKHIGLK